MSDKKVIVGLKNNGSTCFINTFLQSMASLKTVSQYMDVASFTRFPSESLNNYGHDDAKLFVMLRKIIRTIHKSPEELAIVDSNLIKAIYKKMDAPFNTQQDITELMFVFMGLVEDRVPELYKKFSFKQKESCGGPSTQMNALTFFVPPSQTKFNLSKEVKAKVTKCYGECGKNLIHINEPPTCLVVYIYRYTQDNCVRNDVELKFDMKMSVNDVQYKLASVANYRGMDMKGGGGSFSMDRKPPSRSSSKKQMPLKTTLNREDNVSTYFDQRFYTDKQNLGNRGHYFAISKRDGHWFLFDDHNVQPLKKVPTNFAFVLFYERCK